MEGPLSAAPPGARVTAVAAAVVERGRAPADGTVLAVGAGAWHVRLAGFVVSVTARDVPLLPNALRLAARRLDGMPLAVGAPAWLGARELRVGPHRLAFGDPATVWDPRIVPSDPGRLDALGAWLAERTDAAPADLVAALRARAPAELAAVAAGLVGRGAGLTPAGDDTLAGVTAGAHARGEPLLARALCPPDAWVRTTALSATLLDLAAEGAAPEPLLRLLRAGPDDEMLAELTGLGQSTGRAYATGLGAALSGLRASARG